MSANVRSFAAGGLLELSVGNSTALNWDVYTVAAVVRRTANGTHDAVFSWLTSGTFIGHFGIFGNDDTLCINYQSVNFNSSAVNVMVVDGWCLVAWRKVAGTNPVRMSRVPMPPGTNEHDDTFGTPYTTMTAPGVGGKFYIGNNTFSEPFDGEIAGVGMFPTRLSDAAIEGLVPNWDAWVTAGANHLWVLDQAATGTAVNDSIAGGGANQTALTGTSVVSGTAPIEWLPTSVPGAFFKFIESGGLRGLEAGSNRVREDYVSETPPVTGPTALQSVSRGSTGGLNTTTAFTAPLTAGSILIAQSHGNDVVNPTISDSAGHTWNLITAVQNVGNGRMTAWWATAQAGTSPTISINPNNGSLCTVIGVEWAGLDAAPVFTSAVASGNSNAMSVGPTASAPGSGYLGIGMFGAIGGGVIVPGSSSGALVKLESTAFDSIQLSYTVNTTPFTPTVNYESVFDQWVGIALLCRPAGAVDAYHTAVLASSPVAFWPLDEPTGTAAVDKVGARNGTRTGTYTRSSVFGRGAVDVGTGGGYVTTPDAAVFSPHAGASGKMSWEMLVSADGSGSVVSKGDGGLGYEFNISIAGTVIRVTIWPSDGHTDVAANAETYQPEITAGQNYHVVVTYDRAAQQVHIYKNGVDTVMHPSLSWTGEISSDTAAPFTIGAMGVGGGAFQFDGRVACVALYNKVLTAGDVSTHYNALVSPGGVPWSYDFTDDADGAMPSTLTFFGGSLTGRIASGHFMCDVDWFFTKVYDTAIPDQTAITHLIAIEAIFVTAGTGGNHELRLYFAGNADMTSFDSLVIRQDGTWNLEYEGGGVAGSPNLPSFTTGVAHKIVATYNEVSAAFEIFIDDVSRGTGSFSSWPKTGTRSGFMVAGNLDVWVRKFYYGPQSAGVPAGGGGGGGGATAPSAPTGLGATAGNASAVLAWTAPASTGGSAITNYTVQYRTTAGPGSWTTFSHTASTTPGITVTGLTNGTGYDFQVAAVNAIGTGAYSSTASATPTVAGAFTDRGRKVKSPDGGGGSMTLVSDAFTPAANVYLSVGVVWQAATPNGGDSGVIAVTDTIGGTGGTAWVKQSEVIRAAAAPGGYAERTEIWTRKVGTGPSSGTITVLPTVSGNNVSTNGMTWSHFLEWKPEIILVGTGSGLGDTRQTKGPTTYDIGLDDDPGGDSVIYAVLQLDYTPTAVFAAATGYTALYQDWAPTFQNSGADYVRDGTDEDTTISFTGISVDANCLGAAIEFRRTIVPSIVATQTAGGAAVDTVTKPAGAATGDYYAILVQNQGRTVSVPTFGATGFGAIGTVTGANDAAHGDYWYGGLLVKPYSGSEGSSFTVTGLGGAWTYLTCHVVRNALSFIKGDYAQGSSGTLSLPAISPSISALGLISGSDWDPTTWTAAGWIEVTKGASNAAPTLRKQILAGSTGSVAVSSTSIVRHAGFACAALNTPSFTQTWHTSSQGGFNSGGGAPAVTLTVPSWSVTAGDLLVIYIGAEFSDANPPANPLFTVTGGGLTWTQQVQAREGGNVYAAQSAIFTAVATSTTSITGIQVSTPSALVLSYGAQKISGQHASPIGATASDHAYVGADGILDITLSGTPAASSYIGACIYMNADESVSGKSINHGASDGWTELFDNGAVMNVTSGWGLMQAQGKTGHTLTRVRWDDVFPGGAYSTYSWSACAIEIKSS